MVQVYLLTALRCLRDFLRMREGILNLAGKVYGIAKFEKDQVTIAKIILNRFRPGSDDRFAQCEILKDARWRIDFSKDIFVVRYDTEVTGANCFYDSIQVLNAEVI